MFNLYSITKGQQAIREAYDAMVDHTGHRPQRRHTATMRLSSQHEPAAVVIGNLTSPCLPVIGADAKAPVAWVISVRRCRKGRRRGFRAPGRNLHALRERGVPR